MPYTWRQPLNFLYQLRWESSLYLSYNGHTKNTSVEQFMSLWKVDYQRFYFIAITSNQTAKVVYWWCLAFKIFLTQLTSLWILIYCVLKRVLCPVLTFQDLCVIVCCGKFQWIIWSCVKAGAFPVVLPTSFPQLTFEHFPVFWVKYCHEFIHTGHRSQLLFQVFACMSLSK